MSVSELFLLSIGLSMDAFAVAICKGLALEKAKLKAMAIIGLWFGFFQAAMPLLGYFLGMKFASYIQKVDHWVAFVLLCAIGLGMIKEAIKEPGCDDTDASISAKKMFPLAVATSIDALAVGVTFAFLSVNVTAAVSLIGVVTFLLSMLGVKIGSVFGAKYKSRAEICGGIILIALGLKILLEHLGIIAF